MDGTFEVKARREETEFFGSIDPYILLRHNCWNGWDVDKVQSDSEKVLLNLIKSYPMRVYFPSIISFCQNFI
jgi:hypothetical protein